MYILPMKKKNISSFAHMLRTRQQESEGWMSWPMKMRTKLSLYSGVNAVMRTKLTKIGSGKSNGKLWASNLITWLLRLAVVAAHGAASAFPVPVDDTAIELPSEHLLVDP